MTGGGRALPLATPSDDDVLPASWTAARGLFAKLRAAPGEDGAPPDPQVEATVDELNETLEDGPDEGQTWEEWSAEVEDLVDQLNGTPDPCPKFDFPSTGECPMPFGSESVCPTPCIDEHPEGCDIDSLPFDEAEDLYDFVYSIASVNEMVDWEAVDLVQYAWALLLDNLDLVGWIACLFYGETSRDTGFFEGLGEMFGVAGSLAECLTEKIEGRQPDVTIRFSHEKDTFTTNPNPLNGGTIYIPLDSETWEDDYVQKYKDAASGSAEQFCIVADLAATLLHELVHSCVTGGSADAPVPNDGADACSTSYLIENNFRWALGQRYPCLCRAADCDFYFDDRIWRNDGISYPGRPPF